MVTAGAPELGCGEGEAAATVNILNLHFTCTNLHSFYWPVGGFDGIVGAGVDWVTMLDGRGWATVDALTKETVTGCGSFDGCSGWTGTGTTCDYL